MFERVQSACRRFFAWTKFHCVVPRRVALQVAILEERATPAAMVLIPIQPPEVIVVAPTPPPTAMPVASRAAEPAVRTDLYCTGILESEQAQVLDEFLTDQDNRRKESPSAPAQAQPEVDDVTPSLDLDAPRLAVFEMGCESAAE